MDFTSFVLLNTETAVNYAVEALEFFDKDEIVSCEEIGDGNINYVFRLKSSLDGRSLVIKQADRFLRSSGRPLDAGRSEIEEELLSLQNELCPGFVPKVYNYDPVMRTIAMEDISQYKNFRKELMDGCVYPHLAENLSEFLAETLLPTSDLVLDSGEKKARVRYFINPELCDISEDLVFSEPYMERPYRERNKNIVSPGNEAFVKQMLYNNSPLKAEISKLRINFTNNAQALLHGDLHSGSVFVNENGIKVIDPEFAFYGPMGYDIGNVIGNLFFSLAYSVFVKRSSGKEIAELIEECFELCFIKLNNVYDRDVCFELYKLKEFKDYYIHNIMADSLGYAGTEIIRRTVGDSKVPELSSLPLSETKLKMEQALINAAIKLIMERDSQETIKKAISLILKGAQDN